MTKSTSVSRSQRSALRTVSDPSQAKGSIAHSVMLVGLLNPDKTFILNHPPSLIYPNSCTAWSQVSIKVSFGLIFQAFHGRLSQLVQKKATLLRKKTERACLEEACVIASSLEE